MYWDLLTTSCESAIIYCFETFQICWDTTPHQGPRLSVLSRHPSLHWGPLRRESPNGYTNSNCLQFSHTNSNKITSKDQNQEKTKKQKGVVKPQVIWPDLTFSYGTILFEACHNVSWAPTSWHILAGQPRGQLSCKVIGGLWHAAMTHNFDMKLLHWSSIHRNIANPWHQVKHVTRLNMLHHVTIKQGDQSLVKWDAMSK